MSALQAARPGGLCHLCAPPLSRRGDSGAQPSRSSSRSSRAAGMQPSPAPPPTATRRPHLLQSIPSAACTAFVVTPHISACHAAPVSLKMNTLLQLGGGRACWLGCLRRELWQSQVLSSTEHARPVPEKRTVVQAQPGLASPCLVSAESCLPSPFSPALDPAEGGQQ